MHFAQKAYKMFQNFFVEIRKNLSLQHGCMCTHAYCTCNTAVWLAAILEESDSSWDGALRRPVMTILRLLIMFTNTAAAETVDQAVAKAVIRKEKRKLISPYVDGSSYQCFFDVVL
jgi:hypothetical protein